MKLESAQGLRDEIVRELSAAHSVVAYSAQARQLPRIRESGAERLLKHARLESGPAAVGDLAIAAGRGVGEFLGAIVSLPALSIARRVQLSKPAIGITSSGKDSFRVAVRIPRQQLASSPLVQHITTLCSGEVDIRVTGAIRAHSYRDPIRPLQIGWSVGHPHTTAGTIGAFVRMDGDAGIHLLSCNHVLANSNRGRVDDPILQPGRLDHGREPDHIIGKLSRVQVLAQNDPNLFDIALCRLSEDIPYEPRLLGNSGMLTDVAHGVEDQAEQEVQKLGRTTGQTQGKITAFNLTIPEVMQPDGSTIILDQQFEISGTTRAFSEPGDSGALVYNRFNEGVGILNCGDDYGYSFASPLSTVFVGMKLQLAG